MTIKLHRTYGTYHVMWKSGDLQGGEVFERIDQALDYINGKIHSLKLYTGLLRVTEEAREYGLTFRQMHQAFHCLFELLNGKKIAYFSAGFTENDPFHKFMVDTIKVLELDPGLFERTNLR